MMDRSAAIEAAAAFLAEESRQWPELRVKVMPDTAFVDGGALIVSWNSADLVDHGIELAALAGNSPIRVDLTTGACDYVDDDDLFTYMRRGRMG
ncbi:hypothetical protein [Dactylosporangium sp. NPDC005555]|uniref:hypothetical protein n=1 Tax=Dactylosporangium sp. NPDC005555 TaxID=3154889 RepID=UPI0033A15E2A